MGRLKILLRTLRRLARDPRIPRPIRWLLIAGLLPIPGPFDEAVLLLALALVAIFCRPVYRQLKADAEAHAQPDAQAETQTQTQAQAQAHTREADPAAAESST